MTSLTGTKKYNRLFLDTLIFAIGTIGSKLIVFFLLPIYTNALTSAEYGIADLVFTTSELFRPFISLAIYNALLRYGLSKNDRKEDVVLCTTIVFLIGSVIAFLCTPFWGLYDAVSDWKWYLFAYTIVVFLHKIVMIHLKISNKNKIYAGLSILQATAVAMLSILTLVVFNWGIPGYLLSTIIAYAIIALLAIVFGGICEDLKRASFSRALMKKMITYSIPFIANDISWFLIHSSDKYMLERMVNQEALGIYTAASKIPLMVSIVVSIFSQAWDIAVVREYEEENNQSYFSNIFKYFTIVVFGLTIGLAAIIKPFMKIYVSHDFFVSWRYVPMLAVATLLSSFSSFLGAFYTAQKKSAVIMKSTMVAGGVNIVCNYILINKIGIWGAVIGTVVAYFALTLMRFKDLKGLFDIHKDYMKYIQMCLIVCVQVVATSCDFYILSISIVCISWYLILVYKDLKKIALVVRKRLKR